MSEPASTEEQFGAALARHGLCPPEILADGKLHRFDGPAEKPGKKSAWYVLYGDSLPAASFGDWRSGLTETWCAKPENSLSAAERDLHRQRIERARAQAAEDRAAAAEEARLACVKLWEAAGPVRADHPYVKRKRIRPTGAKQLRDALAIPLRDIHGSLRSLQFIQPDGSRRFKSGGVIAGCFCEIGKSQAPGAPLLICEGWATGCTLHEATGLSAVAAMSASNLLAVAQALRMKWPQRPLIVCADDDKATQGNPGLTKAREAAAAVGGRLAIPAFGPNCPDGATDFNDLQQLDGLDAVKRCISAAATAPLETGCSPSRRAAAVTLARASDVKPERITWLWPGWLPAGKLSLLAGSPGTGKTTLAIAIAAVVSRGGTWPDGVHYRDPGNILIWTGEDDLADTLVPRLLAAGADLQRVYFVRSVMDEHGNLQPFDPARDIPLLGDRLNALGGARLLVIDPVVSAVSGDAHRVNDVRRDLQALVDLAAAYRCAVLGISHFAKGTKGSSPAERVIGSQSFVALARMVLVAGKDETAERRILARAKSNIALDVGGVSYTLEQVDMNGIEASRVVWGDLIDGTARDILSDIEQDDEEKTGQEEAQEFLANILADGPMRTREIKADADGAGFNWKMMQRAASNLGVEKRKLGMKEGWEWALAKKTGREEDTKSPALSTVSPSRVVVPFHNHAGLRGDNFDQLSEGDTVGSLSASATLEQPGEISEVEEDV